MWSVCHTEIIIMACVMSSTISVCFCLYVLCVNVFMYTYVHTLCVYVAFLAECHCTVVYVQCILIIY